MLFKSWLLFTNLCNWLNIYNEQYVIMGKYVGFGSTCWKNRKEFFIDPSNLEEYLA